MVLSNASMSKCNFLLHSHYKYDILSLQGVIQLMEPFVLTNKHYETLNFLTLGHQQCEPGYGFGYAFLSYYLIHYVKSGCGTFIKNGVEKKVNSGEIFIIKPDSVYSYTADMDDPWEYIWFGFNGKLAEVYFKDADDIMKVNDDSVIIDMLSARNLKNTQMEFLTGKLYEFISELFEEKETSNNYVKTVSDYIKANYMHPLSVDELSKTINLNSRYLSRVFKEEKGITIKEYIIKKKIAKAKELLFQGISVSDTALYVGYHDPFTFSKIFKKYTGVSPADFKKK